MNYSPEQDPWFIKYRLGLYHDTWELETVRGSYLEVCYAQIKEAIAPLGFDKEGFPIGDLVDIHFHTGDVVTVSLRTNSDSELHILDLFTPCCSI